jgi:hypothetical protein
MQVKNTPVNRLPKLLDQVCDRLRVKQYSLPTEKLYSPWVRRFISFNGKRHFKDLGAKEVEAFFDAFGGFGG